MAHSQAIREGRLDCLESRYAEPRGRVNGHPHWCLLTREAVRRSVTLAAGRQSSQRAVALVSLQIDILGLVAVTHLRRWAIRIK